LADRLLQDFGYVPRMHPCFASRPARSTNPIEVKPVARTPTRSVARWSVPKCRSGTLAIVSKPV
jgi:hypothetical protein